MPQWIILPFSVHFMPKMTTFQVEFRLLSSRKKNGQISRKKHQISGNNGQISSKNNQILGKSSKNRQILENKWPNFKHKCEMGHAQEMGQNNPVCMVCVIDGTLRSLMIGLAHPLSRMICISTSWKSTRHSVLMALGFGTIRKSFSKAAPTDL